MSKNKVSGADDLGKSHTRKIPIHIQNTVNEQTVYFILATSKGSAKISFLKELTHREYSCESGPKDASVPK